MTEHTPGPWVHIPNENFRPGAVLIWTSKGPGHGAICELSGPNHYAETMAQHEANAALIATAPDLLAAAEGVMGDEPDLSHCPYFKGTGQCSSGCSSEPSCQTDRPLNGWPKERLAAAIKKAKGQ